MDNQSYQYLKEKINKAERLQKAVDEINRFIKELNFCNDNGGMTINIGMQGCAGTRIGNYSSIASSLVCEYFYKPLIEAALQLKEQLEQEYKEL